MCQIQLFGTLLSGLRRRPVTIANAARQTGTAQEMIR